jgi:hypothetical protein
MKEPTGSRHITGLVSSRRTQAVDQETRWSEGDGFEPVRCLVLILPGSINLTEPQNDSWMEHEQRIDARIWVESQRFARSYRDREIRTTATEGCALPIATLFLKQRSRLDY